MELARGSVSDRPWGQTLAALGLRGLTGQLALAADDGKRYAIAFERGAVVGASSPLPTDSVIRAALTNHLISSSQVAEISRKLASHPDRDEFDVMVEATGLAAEQAFRLRQRLIAQRAARTFSIDRGAFVVDDTITIPVVAACAVDIRAIVYLGIRLNLSGQRLLDDLRQLGSHFTLRDDAIDDIPQFGLTPSEGPILDVLRRGTTIPELEAMRELDPRTAQSVIYALVACAACDIATVAEVAPRRTFTRSTAAPLRAQLSRTMTTPNVSRTHTTVPPLESRTTTGGIAISRSQTPLPSRTGTTSVPPRPVTVSDSMTTKPSAEPRTRTSSLPTPAEGRTRTLSKQPEPPRTRMPSGTPSSAPPDDPAPSDPRTKTPTVTPSEIYSSRAGITEQPPTVSRTQSPTEPWMTIGTPTGKMPSIPRTGTPIPTRDRTQTLPPLELTPAPEVVVDPLAEAAAAFQRGKNALRMEDLETAVRELTEATQLNPAEVDYGAVRAWAVFCCSTDKSNVIEETRRTLAKAILKSANPEIARFYLGRVERMLGRDKEALRHFNEVLDLQPRHAEAASEKRIIELRLAAANDKSGLFRKR